LCCFSDGFGSLQSERQLFGLCQTLGCPGSPIVTIEIVARQFCHVILDVGMLGAILAVPMLAILKIISDRLRPLKALGHFLEGE